MLSRTPAISRASLARSIILYLCPHDVLYYDDHHSHGDHGHGDHGDHFHGGHGRGDHGHGRGDRDAFYDASYRTWLLGPH